MENSQTRATLEKHSSKPPNPEKATTRIQLGEEVNRVSRSNYEEMTVHNHLLQMALNLKGLKNSCIRQREPVNDVTSPRKMGNKKEKAKQGSKKYETEVLSEKREISKITEAGEMKRRGRANEKKDRL